LIGNCIATRIRPPGEDDNGDPLPGGPTELVLTNCAVAPGDAANITDRGRNGLTVDATLFAPYGSGVLHTDLIRIANAAGLNGTYTVEGEGGSWSSPFNDWKPGDVIGLRRATG
jgi:hypothetical protein